MSHSRLLHFGGHDWIALPRIFLGLPDLFLQQIQQLLFVCKAQALDGRYQRIERDRDWTDAVATMRLLR